MNDPLPHKRLVDRFVDHIFGEALQKSRVLPLVYRPKYRSGRPSTGVDDGTVGNLARNVIPCDSTQIDAPSLLCPLVDHSVADKNNCQVDPEAPVLILWCLRVLDTLVANHLKIEVCIRCISIAIFSHISSYWSSGDSMSSGYHLNPNVKCT